MALCSPEILQLQLASIEISENNRVVFNFSGKTILPSLDATDVIILFHNMETEIHRNHVTLFSHIRLLAELLQRPKSLDFVY